MPRRKPYSAKKKKEQLKKKRQHTDKQPGRNYKLERKQFDNFVKYM
jgi:hypothetical protein